MEPFSAGERVKGMALGALAGEFRSPLGIFSGNSHIVEEVSLAGDSVQCPRLFPTEFSALSWD